MKLMAPIGFPLANQQPILLGLGLPVAQAESAGPGLEGQQARHGPGGALGIRQGLAQ